MAAPAPATTGELLRIDPLELRFPCTCSSGVPRSFLFFVLWGKIPLFFFLFPLAWIDRLVTFLMFPLSSRVEEADLVLHAAVESQQRLHRLQGPFILRRFSFSLFPFNLDALSLPM